MKQLQTLTDLVKIDSSNNCEEIINYIKNNLKGKVTEILDANKFMLIGINTKLCNCSPIVLSGHIDTVPASSLSQFDLKLKDNLAYGLGVIDMKCFTSTILDNIEQLAKLPYPIICVFTTDEETKLNSINLAIDKLKQLNITPKFSIIGEPSNMQFAITSKGCTEIKITVKGKSCHSSKIYEGTNAICITSKIVTFIETLNSEFDNTTLNCGIINGGDIVNRVPDNCSLNFDIRTTNESEKLLALNKIKQFCKQLEKQYLGCLINIDILLEIPSFSLKNNSFIDIACQQFNTITQNFSGGCEAGYFTSYSGDAVIYGVGDTSLCHQINENININEYIKYQINLINFIKLLINYLNK